MPIKIVTSHLLLSANKFQGLLENWFPCGRGWEPWASERTWNRLHNSWGSSKKGLADSGMWKLTSISSWEPFVLKPQFWVQWCYVSTLKPSVEGVFISLTLADITNHGHVFLPGEEVTDTPLVLRQETKDKQHSKVLNLVSFFFKVMIHLWI